VSINKIRLRNFRGFSNFTLDLKPLTVLLGPNSSGKSSFSHPLAATSHCQKLYSGRRDASLTPRNAQEADSWPVDVGGHHDLVTHGFREKVYVDLLTSEGWTEFGFGLLPTSPNNLMLSHFACPQNLDVTAASPSDARPVPPESVKVEVPSGPSKSGARTDTSLLSDVKDSRLILERINEQQWKHAGEDALVGLDGLLPIALQHSTGTEFKLNRKALDEVKFLLDTLVYLRASRKRPSRGYQYFRAEKQSIGYAGERTASVLFNRGSQVEEFLCPPPRASDISEKTGSILWPVEMLSLGGAVAKWLEHLQLAHQVAALESARYGSEYIDMRVGLKDGGPSRDLTEVGFGVSQAIPVIVAALLQPRDSLFIVDLPEAHLHPTPQGEMADLFCSLAMYGRSALVETHSEMFFHRLRLRAAMQPELMGRIVVYFVDAPKSDGTCSEPREVGLNFEEELRWPAGFLQEALDSEIQIRSVRQARTKHGHD
jgi:predicted ATPase